MRKFVFAVVVILLVSVVVASHARVRWTPQGFVITGLAAKSGAPQTDKQVQAKPLPPRCTDSDPSNDPYVKGVITLEYTQGIIPFADRCITLGSLGPKGLIQVPGVNEYSCGAASTVETRTPCSSGRSDGACIKPPAPKSPPAPESK